jgi:protein-disulfide isomerase
LRHRPGRAALGAAVLLFCSASASSAPAQGPASVPAAQRAAIESVIQDYLERHPEVVQKALQAMQAKEEAERAGKQREALALHRKELVEDMATPVGGNPQARVAIVEFFDYSCPHCKHSEPAMQSLLEKDGGSVRIVYKELPILGPGSMYAARAALASMKQGKYMALHHALMESESIDEESVKAVAAKTGLDVDRLLRDMQDPAIDAAIEKNSRLASELDIQGTPAFVIGGQVLPGGVDANVLSALIAIEKAQAGVAQAGGNAGAATMR